MPPNAVLQQRDGRWTVQSDPTEVALLVAARKAGLVAETLEARLLGFTKGAPDVLLARCSKESVGEHPLPLSPERRAAITQANEELASQALRTLGVAARELPAGALDDEEADERVEQDFVFLGQIGMIDPPRDEAKQAFTRFGRKPARLRRREEKHFGCR